MNPVHRALDRAAAFFADRQTRAGYVARRLLQTPHQDDERLAQALVKERRAKMRGDGSVSGDLMATSWVVWELLEMGHPNTHPMVKKATHWLLSRQDKEGAFGLGCSPKRHEMKACEHFIGGFFAYRSAGRTIKRLALPTGAAATSDIAARFLASCFALRSVLRAGEDQNTLVRRHAGSLLALPHLWDTWGGPWSPTLMAAALSAIAWSPEPFRNQLPILAEHLALNQRPDGSWRNLDIVHAVDGLTAVSLPQAREAVALAAPKLAKLQTLKGTIGAGTYAEERTLVAVRAWLIAREYA